MPAAKTFVDGDWTIAAACGPLRTENPLDFQPQTRIYRQRFCQFAEYFSELPLSLPFNSAAEDIVTPSGNWTLGFRGSTTAALAIGASAAALQAALQALATIGANNVIVSGDFTNGYKASFKQGTGTHAVKNTLVGNVSGLSPAYSIKIKNNGSNGGNRIIQTILITPASTANSTGAFLVGETPRQDVGQGVVEWDRVWANVPAAYVEYSGYNYQMQKMQTFRVPWNGTTDAFGNFQGSYRTFIDLAEWSEPLTATVAYNYCLGQAKLGRKNAPFYIPYRIIHYTDSFGNEFVYAVGQWGVAEPTDAQRWMGDIWRVRNVFVSPY